MRMGDEEICDELFKSGLVGVMIAGIVSIVLIFPLLLYFDILTACIINIIVLFVIIIFVEILFRLERK